MGTGHCIVSVTVTIFLSQVKWEYSGDLPWHGRPYSIVVLWESQGLDNQLSTSLFFS